MIILLIILINLLLYLIYKLNFIIDLMYIKTKTKLKTINNFHIPHFPIFNTHHINTKKNNIYQFQSTKKSFYQTTNIKTLILF